jgi:release factor glutamine methyltransferase
MSVSVGSQAPANPVRWRDLLAELDEQVGAADARILLEEAAEAPFALLFARLSDEAPAAAVVRAGQLGARRAGGEPLQHVVGHWSFRELELVVDGRALVPRPETEVVVGRALVELRRVGALRSKLLALDLGTGSGAIALSLAAESRAVKVIASDTSLGALSLAAENRDRLEEGRERVLFVGADWYRPFGPALRGRVDLIVANPPYLSVAEWREAPEVVRDYDPQVALVGGSDGLRAIALIVEGAPPLLAPGGALVLEIGAGQASAAVSLADRAGAGEVVVEQDYAGRDRILVARW